MASQLTKAQLKILGRIYADTDCSNGVYDYSRLHHKQRPIAESMPSLVTWVDGCISIDGDGFAMDGYREGRGYRLTQAGYEALTESNEARYPASDRRFGVNA